MTLTTKFKKDLSTLRAAVNQEIFLDVKHPKLYKKVRKYYENAGLKLNTEAVSYTHLTLPTNREV